MTGLKLMTDWFARIAGHRSGDWGTTEGIARNTGPGAAAVKDVSASVNVHESSYEPAPTSRAPVNAEAREALRELMQRPGRISGFEMNEAMRKGPAAGEEWSAFLRFAESHPQKLSPEAKAMLDIYRRYASAARADGHASIPDAQYSAMLSEMVRVTDVGMSRALERLPAEGPIGAAQLRSAIIEGTRDRDSNAFGENLQFRGWLEENRHRLTPEALAVAEVYDHHAGVAFIYEKQGFSAADYRKLLAEMKAVGNGS